MKIHKKLFGDISNKTLRTKASQTWTFLLYLMHAMDQRYNSLGATGPILVRAGAALVGLVRTFQKATHWMSGESFAMAWEYWKTFVSLTEADARQLIPKRHLMFHLLTEIPKFGTPRLYAVWMDEALNKELKAACRQLSQTTFEAAILLRFPRILRELTRTRHVS